MMAYVIDKLTSTNYSSWSSDIKYILIEKGVWDIVAESKSVSDLPQGSDTEKFKSRASIALSTIYLNVDPEYRRLIEGCNDPVEAWKKLKISFIPDSRAYHMKLYGEMMECKIKPSETINLYAARVLRLFNQIENINPNFDKTYACFQVLRYLPPKLDSIVQNILRWESDKFTFDNIVTELIAEETRINLRDDDREKQVTSIHYADFKEIICWNCKKPGHYKNQCYKFERSPHGKASGDQIRLPGAARCKIFPNQGAARSKVFPKQETDRRKSKPDSRRDTRYRSPSPVQRSTECSCHDNLPRSSGKQRARSSSRKNRKSITYLLTQASLSEPSGSVDWIFDSGASHHFCKDKDSFYEYRSVSNENMAVAIEGVTFPVEGVGKVKLKFGQCIVHLDHVIHSSKLRRNLVSGPRIDMNGADFRGEKGEVKVSKNGVLLFKAFLKNGVYQLFPKIVGPNSKRVSFESSSVNKENLLEIWHRRTGHVNPAMLIHTCKRGAVKGLPILKHNSSFSCEKCKLNKFRRVSYKPLNFRRAKTPLEVLYADVWGPCHVTGRHGERFFLSIIDDYSRRVSLYPIKHKSDVFEVVKRHIIRAENFLGRKVKFFRTDNGTEFVNESFKDFFTEKGIKHELTNIYTPQQNGVAERFNQTVTDGARTILSESGLDPKFWPEAMHYFVYTWNRLCSRHADKTPFEAYGGNKPSVKHFKPFGTVAYVGIPRQRRLKLDAKAKKGIMVGYAFNTKGYRIWIPESNDIIETINVSFSEEEPNGLRDSGAVLGDIDFFQSNEEVQVEVETHAEEDPPIESPPGSPTGSSSQSDDESSSEDDIPPQDLREVRWYRKPVPRQIPRPGTYKQARNNRTDIYYYEENKTQRLRSLKDVERYCTRNNILFKPELFSFRGADEYEGIVPSPDTEANPCLYQA